MIALSKLIFVLYIYTHTTECIIVNLHICIHIFFSIAGHVNIPFTLLLSLLYVFYYYYVYVSALCIVISKMPKIIPDSKADFSFKVMERTLFNNMCTSLLIIFIIFKFIF